MKSRGGFTLPEMMVAIIVLTIVGGAIYSGIRRQQQVFRSITAMTAVRGDVRDAAELLAADLAPTSTLDTLPVARDSAVELYSLIAAAVSCDSASTYTIRVPPEKMQRGLSLTTTVATPDSGDVLLLYRADSTTSEEARWERHKIAGVGSQPAGTVCPVTTGFTTPADAAAPAFVFTLSLPAGAALRRGAPVRVLRRTRYSLYRSSDSRWYLGSRRCNAFGASVCGVIQPVSGPYAGYAAAGQSGLSLRYLDARQLSLSPAAAGTQALRIDVVVRGLSDPWLHPGRGGLPFRDSAVVSVALRNHE